MDQIIKGRSVTVYISDDIYVWPAHRREILDKMKELEELLYSLETGQTERRGAPRYLL